MNAVELKFAKKAIKRGGVLLFEKRHAISFIEECHRFSIEILGIDGFILSSEKTQPSMDNSIDYSTMEGIKDIYHHAIEFLKSQNDNLYFEIICNE